MTKRRTENVNNRRQLGSPIGAAGRKSHNDNWPENPSAPIRADARPDDLEDFTSTPLPICGHVSDARIGANKIGSLVGVQTHCPTCTAPRELRCDNPSPKLPRGALRILTDIPSAVAVLDSEIALLETHWGAILDLMAANDNNPD